MKNIFLILFTLILFCNESKAAFVEGLEDLPVMEGLTQEPNDAISFGNEESRLVEAVLTGKKLTFSKVKTFYKNTLPQMGWTYQGMRENTIIFEREGEVVEISKENTDPLKVRITVKSKI